MREKAENNQYCAGNDWKEASNKRVVPAHRDPWLPDWGEYHYGTPLAGSKLSDAPPGCSSTPRNTHAGDPPAMMLVCGGLRVTFDRDIELRPEFGGQYGMGSGFRLHNNIRERALPGEQPVNVNKADTCGIMGPNCSACPCSQPLAMTKVIGQRTVVLNTTFVSGVPSVLRYAWEDYPTMPIISAEDGRPAAPFNASVPFRSDDDEMITLSSAVETKADDPPWVNHKHLSSL